MRKRIHGTIFILSLLLGLLSFGATASAQDAPTWKIDPVHSNVLFRIKHLGVGYVFGEFNKKGGTIEFDPKNPASASIDLVIDTESVDTNVDKRDNHLRSPDFFEVKQFPKATFKSKKWVKRSEDRFDVTGDLTVHGVTKTITVPVELVGMGKDGQGTERVGFMTTFSVDRRDFGINYMPDGLSNRVKLIFTTEAVKQK